MGQANERQGLTDTVHAVERTCAIISRLQKLGEAGVTELADDLGMSKGTVYKHLLTLRRNGHVVKDGERYRLSLRYYNIGKGLQRRNLLYRSAHKTVDSLAEQSKEFSHLIAEESGRGICLYTGQGEYAVGNDLKAGQYCHLHHIAAGKAILAYLPKDHVEEIIEQRGLPEMTETTITDREALFEECRRIRDRGYSLNVEEEMKGIHAVGAPITGENGEVFGAISVSGPTRRMTEEKVSQVIDMIKYWRNIVELRIHDALTST